MITSSSKMPLVLIVDDENFNLQLIGEVLDRSGYQVMPARSGRQAVARAQLRRPDVVLLDLSMPEMDGMETCRRLRALPGLSDLPVLFVTAVNDRASLISAFAAGAVDYITKPFMVEELLARIKTHVELKLARDRLRGMVRDREDVIDIVAHDLKNPLTCVLFAAHSLARAALDSREADNVSEILGCTEEALQYIQRFLARGAAQERLRQFGYEMFSLRGMAIEAARLMRAAAEAAGVTIRVHGEATAWGDPRVARNVILNLLSNALRHSPSEEEVTIVTGASSRSGFSQCAVMDRGPGVAPEFESKLFQRGVEKSVDPQQSTSRYTSGIGLAIARHDVTQMGGHLRYEPRADGGSIFQFDLPQHAPLA